LELGIYELVFSNFYGGVLVRYRIGDLFKVISIGDEQIGTELPQLRFYSRVDDIIDLSSMIGLTERDIWQTIEAAGIKYLDWAACKEFIEGRSILHIYIELKEPTGISEVEIHDVLNHHFCTRFPDYKDLKEIMGFDPLTVTVIPAGSFNAYIKSKLEAGADLAHLKPPHMKPSDESLKHLLSVLKG
jgi:hypothetical protein